MQSDFDMKCRNVAKNIRHCSDTLGHEALLAWPTSTFRKMIPYGNKRFIDCRDRARIVLCCCCSTCRCFTHLSCHVILFGSVMWPEAASIRHFNSEMIVGPNSVTQPNPTQTNTNPTHQMFCCSHQTQPNSSTIYHKMFLRIN